jgi:hypothetical protein
MATVKSNRQSYYPPISPKPTAQEMALHLKNLYTLGNDHDSAIDLLNQKVTTPAASSPTSGSGTSTLVTKTVIVSQLAGLGGVNDQTGSTTYTPTAADAGIFLIFNDASPVAVTLNSAMVTPYMFFATNSGTGVVTLTPTSGLVNGAASWIMQEGGLFIVIFDGVNWKTSDVLELAQTFAAVTHQFLTSYSAVTGLFTAAQPAFTDISGVATTAQIGTGSPLAGEYVDGGTGAWTALPATAAPKYSPVAASTTTSAAVGQAIFCTTTSAGFTVTLPAVSASSGQVIIVKKVSGDGNTLTVAAGGGDNIDGSATVTTTTQYASWMLVSDGVHAWNIV